MRLSIKLLNEDSTVNNLKYTKTIDISRGETLDVVFQLVDQDTGHRYIPEAGSTVEITILRAAVAMSIAGYNERQTVDDTIKRQAVSAFSGDGSIYKIPLIASETSKMVSGSIKVTVEEGEKIRISQLNQAIRIIDGQER